MFRDKAVDLLRNDIPDDPPEGYEMLSTGDGFNLWLGPVYGLVEKGRLRLGMRAGRRHLNPHGTMHGGIIASFADLQIYVSQRDSKDLRYTLMPTIQLSIDFLSPVVLGDWLVGDTQLLHRTRSVLFQQTMASVGDRPVFRSSAIYRITRHDAPAGSTVGELFA
ncbi:PaaI family thioesterase [Paracoccus lichenicola]|nr:PaaI family thioesterase [Paracoccus lichenicola]